jgi:hypothetical protein
MRRLAITGFCAIALLSACDGGRVAAGGGVRGGPQTNDITLPCPGKDLKTGEWKVDKNATPPTLRFFTDGRCKFTDLQFDPPYTLPKYPPGFKNRVSDPNGKAISYDYDPSTPIAATGYAFSYTNDDKQDGNGSGVIK